MTAANPPGGTLGDFHEEALPHMDAVFRFALRLTGSRDGAEDLVQETFLRAFRSWESYTPGTRCKSWLFTICRNLFLREKERNRRHEEILSGNVARDSGDLQTVNPLWGKVAKTDPEGEFFESIVDEVVFRHVNDLPEDYRVAVVLSDLEGFSYREIADMTEVPVGTVKSRLFRGRRMLQQVLYEYAISMGYIEADSEVDAEERE